MKVKIDTPIKTIEGKDMKEMVDGQEKVITIKKFCVNAVLANPSDNAKETGEQKVKRYELAKKIQNAKKEIDLSSEEISLIKKEIGINYPPIVVGQAYEILEGK